MMWFHLAQYVQSLEGGHFADKGGNLPGSS